MLRRTIALALAGLAIAAPPALAESHWNSQMKDATATASRTAGGCTIRAGSRRGSLLVTCDHNDQATLTYVFPIGSSKGKGGGGIQGKPMCLVGWWGFADLHRSVKVSGNSLRVTVTVTDGTARLNTVSVGYYSS
jgi:hypothetical protein